MEMDHRSLRPGCVIMAAGNGLRYGGNKLLAEFGGRPLIEWAVEAVPPELLPETVIVTRFAEIEALAAARGIRTVRNDAPELGISRTVALGTAALKDVCGGLLFLVADQPLLKRETVRRLVAAWTEASPPQWSKTNCLSGSGAPIVVPCAGGRRGNPCLFPADLFPELEALTGDRGGSQVIRRHPDRVLPVEVAPEELADVDTAAALADMARNRGESPDP